MNLPRASTLLVLGSLALPACVPGKFCIGDCLDTDDGSSGAASGGQSETGADDPSTGDVVDPSVTSTTMPPDPTGEPLQTCELVDDFDPYAGCGDGVPHPGELCFIEGFGTSFPAGVLGALPVAIDGGGADVVVSHPDRTVTAVLDGVDPDLDLSKKTWPFDFPPGALTLTDVGDVDEDGHLDVVGRNASATGDTVEVVRVAGDGSFLGETNLSVGTLLFGPAVVDWDQDGHLDLAVITPPAEHPGENVILLRGDGTGAFTPEPAFGVDVSDELFAIGALGPADAVRNDFVFAGTDGEFTVQISGPGDNTIAVDLGPGASYRAIEISELDGDGRGDIAVLVEDTLSGTTAVAVLLQIGTPAEPDFAVTRWPVRCGATTFALGDLDADGALDLVAGGPDSTRVTMRRGDGEGHFEPIVHFDLISAPERLHIADFTGNGSADVLIVTPAEGTLNIASSSP